MLKGIPPPPDLNEDRTRCVSVVARQVQHDRAERSQSRLRVNHLKNGLSSVDARWFLTVDGGDPTTDILLPRSKSAFLFVPACSLDGYIQW